MDLPSQPVSLVQPPTPVVPPPPPPPPPVPVGMSKKPPIKMILISVLALILLGGGAFLAMKIFGVFKPKSAESVTLTWWGLWEADSTIKPLIDEYQTTHPNIKINYIFQSQREYRERLQNALSQGSGPDIFRIHNTWIPMFKANLAPIPAEVYSAQTFEATFYPVAKTDLRVGSNYVAVPLEFDGLAMSVNEDLFSAAGKTVPQSWG